MPPALAAKAWPSTRMILGDDVTMLSGDEESKIRVLPLTMIADAPDSSDKVVPEITAVPPGVSV